MPELPEVESVRLGLKSKILGQSILSVSVLTEKIVSSNSNIRNANKEKTLEFVKNLKGKKIVDVKRRAKNIIIELETSEIILVHLKMTGQLIYTSDTYSPTKHTHVLFGLENGNLYYNDVRRFGYVLYYKSLEHATVAGHFAKIGLEPFDKNFTQEYFREEILKKRKNLKQVLLEQSVVVGCGNIYADEICFASAVLPNRICNTLTLNEIEKMHHNIKSVLKSAIKSGGSSISDYRLSDGSKGSYASMHQVYGRSGLVCFKCDNILEKEIISGRTTVYCLRCQK